MRAPKDGSASPTLIASGTQNPYRIAVDEGHVYCTEPIPGRVLFASKTGGTAFVLAVDPGFPIGIAIDDTHVYWTSSTSGCVSRIKKDGSGWQELALIDGGAPRTIAVGGDHVYWTNAVSGTVMKVPKTGGDVVVLASDQLTPDGIALNAECVYWTYSAAGGGSGSVMTIAR